MPDWYVASGSPGTRAGVDSAPQRSEFAAIAGSFAKLPALAGQGLKIVRINSGGTAMEPVGAIDNIPIGSTTPSTGAFTTLSASGAITASGGVVGNASTATLAASATKLATARNINGVAFDGTAPISVNLNNALTAGGFLTSGGTFDGSAPRTFAVDATSANTASKVVARDASGNFSAGTITATLAGNASTASAVGNSLSLGTHLSGGSFNGSAPITISTDATSANTASAIVARDGSGNFTAGQITAASVLLGNGGGLGLGQIGVTTTPGTPAGGTNGDLMLVY